MKVIQTKFIIIILSGILLSTIIFGGVAVMSSNRVISQNSEDIMNLICKENANDINYLLTQIERSVEIISMQALDTLKEPDKLSDNIYRSNYTKELEGAALNIAKNTEGTVGVFMRFNPEIADGTSGFFWSRDFEEKDFHKTFLTDLLEYEKDDNEHVGWYYIPVANKKATWLEPYLNRKKNIYMVSYIIPLYYKEQLIGIVGMDIDFNTFIHATKSIKVYDSGYAFLTNKDGRILYHSRQEEDAKEYDDEEWENIVNDLTKMESETELIHYKYRNEEKMMTFSYLHNGMKLVIAAPVSEIDKEKNRMIATFIIAAILISIFFVVLTVKNTNAIVRFAYRDVLTGALNKNAYNEELNHLEEQIHFSKAEFAVGVFDINDLKKENDTYGHSSGDKLIINSFNLIRQIFKKYSVYRIGGDEFVVIMKNCSLEEYKQLIQNFKDTMEKRNSNLNTGEKEIYVACGLAWYDVETDLTYADVFDRADRRMYENKIQIKQNTQDIK